MYKLSIVEKAKRYDEAIKKLRSLHDNYDIVSTLIDVKEELENIFPELAESEDEKVKKAILGMVYDSDNELWSSYDVSKSDVLAWLEKHSQVKEFPISQYENKTCKENDDSLTSEDERIGKAITEFFKNYSKNGTWKAIPNITKWIAWLEKQGEKKSTEWSEEDKKMIDAIYSCVDSHYDGLAKTSLLIWLKSLKDRYTWKPSEGQMVALNCAITAASDDLVCLNVKDLESLYEQLKKLKG